jgi:hypothetical protein
MYTKGKIRADGAKLARYLTEGGPGETAHVIDTRGWEAFGSDPVTAFDHMDLWAAEVSRSTKPFFHGHIRLPADEQLTDEQWRHAVDRMEKRLGFPDQPRIVSFHIDNETGEKHLHVAWFRIDLETEQAIDPGLFKNHLKQLSRKLEREFGLRELTNDRRPENRARDAGRDEFEQARRLGTDINEVRTAILDCYQQSDSGKAFKAALESRGFELANGDRRDCFVAIDPAGGLHALNKKLTGQTLGATREKLADLDRSQLPSVEQAQALQAERQHAREAQAAQRSSTAAPDMEEHGAARGPYAELQAAQTESRFTIGAEQATAPRPETFDRDAADADWNEKLAAAAIAKDEAARADTTARQEPEAGKGSERDRPTAEGRYAGLQPPEPAPEVKPGRGLTGTAAEMRQAWALSRTMSELEDALAARGISLAEVSREEAYASERHAALAQAAGNFGTVWREGEIVAVNGHGQVFGLNERTTGDARGEIEGRLVGLDRDALLSVADTAEAMRAASWAAELSKRQAEREAARPATALEGRIIECAEQARLFGAHVQKDEQGEILLGADVLAYRMRDPDERTGEAAIVHGPDAFAARLDAAGIAIVRVTATDIRALDALRQDEDAARRTAAANGETRKEYHFAELAECELAAVTRGGDVHRLNADKLRGVEIAVELPGVIEARVAFEIDREQRDVLYAGRSADHAAAQEAFGDRQVLRQGTRAAEHAVHETFEGSATVVDTALHTTSGLLGGAAKMVEALGDFLGGLFGGPKLTRQQAHEAAQARGNEETLHARDYAATVQAQEAEFDERMHALKTSQQQEDLSFAQRYGTPPTREANLGRDHEHERERERDRD